MKTALVEMLERKLLLWQSVADASAMVLVAGGVPRVVGIGYYLRDTTDVNVNRVTLWVRDGVVVNVTHG